MNSDMTYNLKQEYAKILYTKEEYTVKEVAKRVETTEAIVRNWISEGNWEAIKRCKMTWKEAHITNLYAMLDQLHNKEDKTYKEAGEAVKLTTAIKNLETEYSLSPTLEVGERFLGWLYKRNTEMARVVTLEFDKYVKETNDL
ncbi:MAG: hypothetical protein V4649_04250 [Bacteroidota bacterium]